MRDASEIYRQRTNTMQITGKLLGILLILVLSGTAQAQRQRGKAQPAPAAPPAEAAATFPTGPPVEEATLKALKARSIGPAVMSGRVADIALDPKDPATFYIALGTGGVMKTSNNGASWDGIFEDQPVAAVGAVAVARSDPKVVWVG